MRTVRTMLHLAGFLGSAYAFIWGVSWLMADQSFGVTGTTADGQPFSYYPGALLGGLPPQPWFWSDAPQLIAAFGGAIGMAVIARRLARPPTARPAGGS